jgi:hypothetical protein
MLIENVDSENRQTLRIENSRTKTASPFMLLYKNSDKKSIHKPNHLLNHY